METKERIIDQWMRKADNDLKSAEILLEAPESLGDNVCVLSQQAAEKYLKALLVYLGIEFQRSHSLTYLLGLLTEKVNIKEKMFDIADFLTPFAVDLRYPGDLEVSLSDAEEALDGAAMIKEFVLNIVTNN